MSSIGSRRHSATSTCVLDAIAARDRIGATTFWARLLSVIPFDDSTNTITLSSRAMYLAPERSIEVVEIVSCIPSPHSIGSDRFLSVGLSVFALGAEFGIHRTSVSATMRRHGLPMCPR